MANNDTKKEAHQFSLYVPQLFSHISSDQNSILLKDEPLRHRIITVLRLVAGEQLVLFDETYNVVVEIMPEMLAQKKIVHLTVLDVRQHEGLKPEIILGIGLVKKSSLEEIAYHAGQLGITKVVPLLCEKVQRRWGGEKELGRLNKSAVAGCEQAKNFMLPVFDAPTTLADFYASKELAQAQKVFFECGGTPFLKVLNDFEQKKPKSIVCVIGPEGGLTNDEQEKLVAQGFEKVSLTPTVLRSIEAVVVGVGGVRAL